MFKTIPSWLVSLLEQNLHMKITICECKYFEKCVNTDRNLLLYENIQKITIQKVFTSGKKQKAYGSNILADQRLVFVEK